MSCYCKKYKVGATGIGSQGATGANITGATGTTIIGATGFLGASGISDILSGSTGATGATGFSLIGLPGTTGLNNIGATGANGVFGFGTTGATGIGLSGPIGSLGVSGILSEIAGGGADGLQFVTSTPTVVNFNQSLGFAPLAFGNTYVVVQTGVFQFEVNMVFTVTPSPVNLPFQLQIFVSLVLLGGPTILTRSAILVLTGTTLSPSISTSFTVKYPFVSGNQIRVEVFQIVQQALPPTILTTSINPNPDSYFIGERVGIV